MRPLAGRGDDDGAIAQFLWELLLISEANGEEGEACISQRDAGEGQRRARRIGSCLECKGSADCLWHSRFSWTAVAAAIGPPTPTPTGRSSSHVLCV